MMGLTPTLIKISGSAIDASAIYSANTMQANVNSERQFPRDGTAYSPVYFVRFISIRA